ncbi:MAG: xanthine dehydrogenase family protein molybdopterin-binding subunit, partial [Acidobacteriota bacterium]
EPTAEDAARAVRVKYEVLEHLVRDDDPAGAGDHARPMAEQVKGNPDTAFRDSEVVSEGEYGTAVITHCCLESHGSVAEWEDDENLLVHISTQNVSGIAGQMAGPLGIPAGNIRVEQQHIGGGFGSKFGPDRWGITAAQLSRKAGGRPVKIMLERDAELMVAGARPSAYARVKVAGMKDGTLTAWDSESWGTSGMGGGGRVPLPYIFKIPHQRTRNTAIANNIGGARAWRAPGHPQACLITMGALEDLAARIGMDPLEFFLKNIHLTGRRSEVYRKELEIAADLISWRDHWHPRGNTTPGSFKRGLGLAIHTWGGRGHESNCDLTIHPDGSVEVKLGTQDLGTGTRTAIAQVVADTFGLTLGAIKVLIGDNRYPASGPSGGSTTIGGVSSACRRGAQDALEKLFELVAPELAAQPADLEAVDGRIRVASDSRRSLGWAQTCSRLRGMPLTMRGTNPGTGDLINSGVGGVQMADVEVDVETGVISVKKMVAVQDCGLIINRKLAESQIHGAMIMGITYSLFEEKIMDQTTGRMLNPNMEFYRLAGLADVGDLVVHLMTGPDHDARGVIGLGEPPVISPGAAISNAVANAIGVRVPHLPMTPDRVLRALERRQA